MWGEKNEITAASLLCRKYKSTLYFVSIRGFPGWAAARLWWRNTWPFSATWFQRRLSTCAPASRWSSPTSLPVRPQTSWGTATLNWLRLRRDSKLFLSPQSEWPSAREGLSSPTRMTKTRVGHFKCRCVEERRSTANDVSVLFFRRLQELRPVPPGFAAHL